MTFLSWLRTQAHRRDHVGDLARDVRADESLPLRLTHLSRWQAYLRKRHACEGALDALEDAWGEFEYAYPGAAAGPLTPRARFSILQRDGFRGQYCGASSTREGVRLEVDHITALADGGTHHPSNLITACQPCNQGKRASILVEIEPS